MKQSLHITPTTVVTVDGKQVQVILLPDEIRFEIETLDRYNQDSRNAYAELEKTQLLVNAKKMHVEQLLSDFFKKKPTDPEAG